jgi:hypothetical protein
MAKKAVQKKRKGGSPAPKSRSTTAEGDDPNAPALGEVLIPVQCQVNVPLAGTFDELVIEWSCLGLSEEPDSIKEISGNSEKLDSDRPPATDDEGLHVFFKPALQAGNYGFKFAFMYNSAVEARTADPEEVKKLQEEREEFQAPAEEAGA